jgi:probable rRNA maturation factor
MRYCANVDAGHFPRKNSSDMRSIFVLFAQKMARPHVCSLRPLFSDGLLVAFSMPCTLPLSARYLPVSAMSEHDIEVQFALVTADLSLDPAQTLPDATQIQAWIAAALVEHPQPVEVSVRVVDEAEMCALNQRFRQQPKSTNVLSFPAGVPEMPALLGDLVICAAVVQREASEQDKPLHAHYAHMAVHGTLHLLGYDHQDDAQAAAMEHLEREILAGLGYADPYREGDHA